MANLTHDTPRSYLGIPHETQDYPCAVAEVIQGSAVSDAGSPGAATGVAATLTAGENFLGFAYRTVDNTANVSGQTITVVTSGEVQLPVTGVTSASLGAEVYASDGNTFTLTSTSNSAVGRVARIVSGTTVIVRFTGVGYKSI